MLTKMVTPYKEIIFKMETKLSYKIFLLLVLIVLPLHAENPETLKKPSFREWMETPKSFTLKEETITYRPSWFIPDNFSIQHAGLIGYMSIGVGYDFNSSYHPTLYYGLLSESFGGSSVTVHTVSLKNSWDLIRRGRVGNFTPKAGVSINFGYTNNTFQKLPAHYPNRYYFQNKVHAAPFWGVDYKRALGNGSGFFKAASIYAEMSTLDAYVLELVRTKYVSLDKIWNLSLGVTLYIH